MITLQNLVVPEPGLKGARGLYFVADDGVEFSRKHGRFTLAPGARVDFGTYFNLFNVARWQEACNLDSLFVEFDGTGAIEVTITRMLTPEKGVTLLRERMTLGRGEARLDLCDVLADGAGGLLLIAVEGGEGGAVLDAARFVSAAALPDPLPRLAVSITTFRRETQVEETVARLDRWLEGFVHAGAIHVQVVDNGQSAAIADSDRVSVYPNPNFGGSGGFARGLLEAETNGFTHCLFMDDDASFHMENIARTYMFLALARDPRTAVAGAMISNLKPWELWENGAWFDEVCRALNAETDLRDRQAVFAMELAPPPAERDKLYGAWWFFAFAIGGVTHYPFPFFVRGDDISFGLMNDFHLCTLNGVVSFQDDFAEKESPFTLYLDVRHSLVQHLVSPQLERGALGTARVGLRFVARALFRFHYDSARAMLMGWRDVMQGPEVFDRHIDMAERRSSINALLDTEKWRPLDAPPEPERRWLTLKSKRFRRLLCILTLNGHLVPFSRLMWDRVTVPIENRSSAHESFGAARVSYVNADGTMGYRVEQSKWQFLLIALQTLLVMAQFAAGFGRLRRAYREGYSRMATKSYWQGKAGAGQSDGRMSTL